MSRIEFTVNLDDLVAEIESEYAEYSLKEMVKQEFHRILRSEVSRIINNKKTAYLGGIQELAEAEFQALFPGCNLVR
jgi:hypothetical protein